MEIIALDAHKRYSQVCVQRKNGQILYEKRINHNKGEIKQFLSNWTAGANVAVETVGNWYWIVDEIEQAGMEPLHTDFEGTSDIFGSRGREQTALTIKQLPDIWLKRVFGY